MSIPSRLPTGAATRTPFSVVCPSNKHILHAYMVCMYGVHIWCAYMVCMYGVHVWCACMVCMYGVHVWCACMVWMFRTLECSHTSGRQKQAPLERSYNFRDVSMHYSLYIFLSALHWNRIGKENMHVRMSTHCRDSRRRDLFSSSEAFALDSSSSEAFALEYPRFRDLLIRADLVPECFRCLIWLSASAK